MENIYDKILKDQALGYEDLTTAEQETYNKSNFAPKTLSVGDVKNYVSYMKNSIALQLTNTSLDDELKIVLLQARLKNYILLEMFLLAPEKAEEAFKKQVAKKAT